jgi:gas vesicle protein
MRFVSGFFFGLSVGSLLALVLAPQPGSDTRRFLADQARHGAEQARRRAEEARSRLRNQGQEWMDEAAGVISHRNPWEHQSN